MLNGTAWSDCGDINSSYQVDWVLEIIVELVSVNAGVFIGGQSGAPSGSAWAGDCTNKYASIMGWN